MLVWLGVIRYLGFFQKYNVRIPRVSMLLVFLSPCGSAWLWLRGKWILMASLPFPAPYSHPAGSAAQCHQVLLLCRYDLLRLLLLWMDCAGAVPR